MPVTLLNEGELNMPLKARRGKVSVPAPAVIPALLAYIEVDAVKTLVVGDVGMEDEMVGGSKGSLATPPIHWIVHVRGFDLDYCPSTFTLRKLECSWQSS